MGFLFWQFFGYVYTQKATHFPYTHTRVFNFSLSFLSPTVCSLIYLLHIRPEGPAAGTAAKYLMADIIDSIGNFRLRRNAVTNIM